MSAQVPALSKIKPIMTQVQAQPQTVRAYQIPIYQNMTIDLGSVVTDTNGVTTADVLVDMQNVTIERLNKAITEAQAMLDKANATLTAINSLSQQSPV